MNPRCALQEMRLDIITPTGTMNIRGRQSISINERGNSVEKYRSTHGDRQYTAGDSAAADAPFLPCRSGVWNSVTRALGIDLTEWMPNGAVQLETVAEK